MHIHEDIALRMAKERMEDAARVLDRARALAQAGVLRPSARVRLGAALIRLGRRIQGLPSPLGASIEPHRA